MSFLDIESAKAEAASAASTKSFSPIPDGAVRVFRIESVEVSEYKGVQQREVRLRQVNPPEGETHFLFHKFKASGNEGRNIMLMKQLFDITGANKDVVTSLNDLFEDTNEGVMNEFVGMIGSDVTALVGLFKGFNNVKQFKAEGEPAQAQRAPQRAPQQAPGQAPQYAPAPQQAQQRPAPQAAQGGRNMYDQDIPF
jgi:hypothetical protein